MALRGIAWAFRCVGRLQGALLAPTRFSKVHCAVQQSDMQSTSQSCGRITWLLRHTAASFAEFASLTAPARISATNNATCSCSYTTGSTAGTALRASPTIGMQLHLNAQL